MLIQPLEFFTEMPNMVYMSKASKEEPAKEDTTSEENVELGVDFGFFQTDKAKIEGSAVVPVKKPRGKKDGPSIMVGDTGNMRPEPGAAVMDADYTNAFNETNTLLRATIIQTDTLNNAIKEDLDKIRASSTLKNKYSYITDLTSSSSSLISTKIQAIREINSSISNAFKLEMDRLKALKLNENADNDEARMMDLYSAFVNTPIGTYNNPLGTPSITEVAAIPTMANTNAITITDGNSGRGPLTPEQQAMRLENNPNIKTVLKFDQSTGARFFDVVDMATGQSIPNMPRPDNFLLEDTIIDVHMGIARNRNLDQVWPVILIGDAPMSEY